MIQKSSKGKAAQCTNMSEIRTEIDRIDREVISLLGERYEFVKAASQFKSRQIRLKLSPALTLC